RTEGIDPARFIQASQRVVDRHPIPRTSFHHEGMTKAVQVVRRRVTLPVQEQDWRGLPPADQAGRLGTWLDGERSRKFSLTEAPLLRLAVIRSGETSHRHVWSYHPILWDSWSRSLFFQEVFACYQALSQGQDHNPAAPYPYRDYILWLQQQDRATAEAFWRK